MPNITLASIQGFLANAPLQLKPSQRSLCLPVLNRIIDKINRGAAFSPIQVVDDLIINGHHRYICYSLLNLPVETINWRKSAAHEAGRWDEVTVDITDWDKPEDIEKHEKDYFPPTDNSARSI